MLFAALFLGSFVVLSIPRGANKRNILLNGWGPFITQNLVLSLVLTIIAYFGVTLGG